VARIFEAPVASSEGLETLREGKNTNSKNALIEKGARSGRTGGLEKEVKGP